MTWPAPRKSRRVPIRPACPILTIRSTCRSIRPSRPSTCSIIRGARPSRSASTCSSSIPAAGCASSTISLCEYALPFPAENDVVVSLFTFPRRNARRYFSPAICKNTNLHKDLSGEHVHGPVHRQELDVGRHEGKTPHRRPLLFPLRRTAIDFGVVAFDTWRAPNPRQRGLPPSAIEHSLESVCLSGADL